MSSLERIGSDDVSGRSLFVLDCSDPADVAPAIDVEGRFICLLAWDAGAAAEAEISQVAERLLAAGCVYICTWGRGCDRVHDIFDQADLARAPDGPWAMSTSHDDEPLDEAIWFFLFNAYPDPSLADRCLSAVGVSIGMPSWAKVIRTAMKDPRAFNRRIVGAG